ncbi:trans-resveratrol di-O-methyltransferase [Cajanus cajan]|uniref:trans-resveratrol di-O-methyltransferase n=1 Tax=Cajanus cajan TaxID=3821 RepID=UPI00098D7832|nr:trans-resveratrol di-O-methyltransferase [Cajanus cajan]
MDSYSEEDATKLLRAQTHVWNHILKFISSMSLKCAIELSIPDIIHKYGQPMPLSQLIASLPIHPSKSSFIYRLMRILTHFGFISQHNIIQNDKQEVRYELTDPCKLLLKDNPLSMTSLLQALLDPICINLWHQFSTWFTNEDPTTFHTEKGTTFYEFLGRDPFNHLFNDGMASDTQLVSSVMIEKCKGVFKGLKSLVDVGGGTGTMAKTIAKSFPQLECIVFDLPHVVNNLQGAENLKYFGGDMFEGIPPADSVLLKWILHNWNDEECVKILNKCKEAIPNQGKIIIIDLVMESKKEDKKLVETQLFLDMQMMVFFIAKERNEKEWANLISSAGFSDYKITPALGLNSIIEVYP